MLRNPATGEYEPLGDVFDLGVPLFGPMGPAGPAGPTGPSGPAGNITVIHSPLNIPLMSETKSWSYLSLMEARFWASWAYNMATQNPIGIVAVTYRGYLGSVPYLSDFILDAISGISLDHLANLQDAGIIEEAAKSIYCKWINYPALSDTDLVIIRDTYRDEVNGDLATALNNGAKTKELICHLCFDNAVREKDVLRARIAANRAGIVSIPAGSLPDYGYLPCTPLPTLHTDAYTFYNASTMAPFYSGGLSDGTSALEPGIGLYKPASTHFYTTLPLGAIKRIQSIEISAVGLDVLHAVRIGAGNHVSGTWQQLATKQGGAGVQTLRWDGVVDVSEISVWGVSVDSQFKLQQFQIAYSDNSP